MAGHAADPGVDLYCVFGNPVAHSKSPRIHALFAAQTGERLRYEAVLAAPGAFPQALAAFRARGGRGCNVTVPFKEDAWRCCAARSERADLAQAVNTIRFEPDGRAWGDNTDGVGLVRDLTANLGFTLAGRRLLVLGAGGATRGILGPLLAERPALVVVANRTAERATALVARYAGLGTVSGGGYDLLDGQRFDLVLDATSAGLRREAPLLPGGLFAAGGVAYALVYGPAAEPFLAGARLAGAARAADGLGMLVEQAAESYALWRGRRPATAPVIAALRGR